MTQDVARDSGKPNKDRVDVIVFEVYRGFRLTVQIWAVSRVFGGWLIPEPAGGMKQPPV